MDKTTLLTIYGIMFLFFLFLVLSFIKAKKHLDYLRNMFPDEYTDYPSYSSSFSFGNYNVKIQFLVLPFFFKALEHEIEKSVLLRKFAVRYFHYQIGALILFVGFTIASIL